MRLLTLIIGCVTLLTAPAGAQVLCGRLGTALNCLGPDGSMTTIAPFDKTGRSGVIMTDKGIEPFLIMPPSPPPMGFDPAPLKPLAPLPTLTPTAPVTPDPLFLPPTTKSPLFLFGQ